MLGKDPRQPLEIRVVLAGGLHAVAVREGRELAAGVVLRFLDDGGIATARAAIELDLLEQAGLVVGVPDGHGLRVLHLVGLPAAS